MISTERSETWWLDRVKSPVRTYVEQDNAASDCYTYAWMIMGYVHGVLDMFEVPYSIGEVDIRGNTIRIEIPVHIDEREKTLVIEIDVEGPPKVLRVELR